MNNLNLGCCSVTTEANESYITCLNCNKDFHYACLSLNITEFSPEMQKVWTCPECINIGQRTSKSDETPIRNISTTRGNKRLALNSPPMESVVESITREDIREVVQEVFNQAITDMFSKLNDTILSTINKEIKPLRDELSSLSDSISIINTQHKEVIKQNQACYSKVMTLETENEELKSKVLDLQLRCNLVEQKLRQNNIEIQCIPERKNENLMEIITVLGKAVGCEINDKDVLHITRTSKNNRANSRPRSIVVQLSSPRLRDQILAGVAKHNKKNPDNKFNTSLVGLAGTPTPVYVSEHLSPANKALHAAARLKAKEKSYRFVWVRNGRILMRKNEESEYVLVKNLDVLNTLE